MNKKLKLKWLKNIMQSLLCKPLYNNKLIIIIAHMAMERFVAQRYGKQLLSKIKI